MDSQQWSVREWTDEPSQGVLDVWSPSQPKAVNQAKMLRSII